MSDASKLPMSFVSSDAVATVRRNLAQAHVNHPYYSNAEADNWLGSMWAPGSPFLSMFGQLDLSDVVEIACGYGRHAAQFVDRAGRVTLTDINDDSIAACRTRFKERGNVVCLVNNGIDLSDLASDRYSAVFSYDAMVHFEASDVINYIFEVARILRPGGKALLHYSNYQGCPEGTYADGPHWRSFFSEAMFRHFACRAGLHVVQSKLLAWPSATETGDLDALTLAEKI